MPFSLPVVGHAIETVEGEGRFALVFDDPVESVLAIDGEFTLTAGDEKETFVPPLADWVRDVLLSLARVNVTDARFDRNSNLRISFEDGREVFVGDGPFENWRYRNRNGDSIIGGVGRVVRFGLFRR